MRWIVDAAAVLAFGTGVWIIAPAVRTILRHGFGPSRRNDASVFYAEQSSHP
jgi:hypothetical protein